jgi:hypothetical protein
MTTSDTQAPSTTEAAQTAAPVARAADRPLSITALVLGIASIVFGQTFLVPIAAIALGVIGYRQEPAGRTLAVIGAALGGLAMFGWILFVFIGLALALPLVPFVFFGAF